MTSIEYNLPRLRVLVPNETLENVFISACNILLITSITHIITSVFRSNSVTGELSISHYFDFIAFQEAFNLDTWKSWFRRSPEFPADIISSAVTEKRHAGAANRRMVKALLAQLLIVMAEFLVLVLFSRTTRSLSSEHVQVVAAYKSDGLEKYEVDKCVISPPEKRREQLSGLFAACTVSSAPDKKEVFGEISYTIELLHSSLNLTFLFDEGEAVTSIVHTFYSQQETLDVKIDAYWGARTSTALAEAFTRTNCKVVGDDIGNASLVDCTGLNFTDIGLSISRTIGFVGGNYTLGHSTGTDFVEVAGVEIGTYTSPMVPLIALPLCVLIALLLSLVLVFILNTDSTRIVSLALMERAGDICSWGYLFADKGTIAMGELNGRA